MNIKSALALFGMLLCSLLVNAQDTTLVLPGKLGVEITVPVVYLDSAILEIQTGIQLIAKDAEVIKETIKEESPKTAMDWLILLLTGGLLPIVTSLAGELTKLIRSLTGLLRDDRIIMIIGSIASVLSAGYTLVITGFDTEFFSVWPGVFLFALGGSMLFYEKVIKGLFNRSKGEEITA